MKTSSAKAKGRRTQQMVAQRLRAATGLPEADVVSRPMGSPGVDILLSRAAQTKIPFAIEVKCQEKVNVWASFEQAKANAGELDPLLVIARNRTEPLVVLRFEDFLQWLTRAP